MPHAKIKYEYVAINRNTILQFYISTPIDNNNRTQVNFYNRLKEIIINENVRSRVQKFPAWPTY